MSGPAQGEAGLRGGRRVGAHGRAGCLGGPVLPEVATGAVATSERSRPHLLLASGSRGPAQVSLVLHTMGK